MLETSQSILKEIYKKLPKDMAVRKYDFGLLLVIGGSDFYSGSPALSAMAAFRSGVDMVRIIAPKRAADIIASFSPNLAAYPLEGKRLGKEHLATLLSMTESARLVARENVAVVIGGGIGRTQETQEAILDYLSQISVPAVIDADAIHAVAKNPQVLSGKPFLLTPHTYEFFILTGKEVFRLSEEEKINRVKEESERLKTTILLKGGIDIIAAEGKTALNKTGTPYMSVGGTGDTLAGIAGAILARKIDCFNAGCASAFINGLAGERAAKKLGQSMTATDLIEEIAGVLPQ